MISAVTTNSANIALRKRFESQLVRHQIARQLDLTYASSEPIRLDEFMLQEPTPIDWLVKNLLVAGEFGLVAGPEKSLKSSLMLDVGVSLTAGVDALDRFEVPIPRRVLMISGEISPQFLQRKLRHIMGSKRLSKKQRKRCLRNLHLEFTLPQLSTSGDLESLCDKIQRINAEVAIIDPMYLCLLAGSSGTNAANMMEMGPLLLGISTAIKQAGATPIMVHHTNAEAGKSHRPISLSHTAYAGPRQFARQFLLLNHRCQPEDGHFQLWLSVGGPGMMHEWAVDVREGISPDSLDGVWEVKVQSAAEARGEAIDKRHGKKAKMAADKEQRLRTAVADYLRSQPDGDTRRGIEDNLKERGVSCPRGTLKPVLEAMIESRDIEKTMVKKAGGTAGNRGYDGYRWVGAEQ